jgi:hypothetical protein
MQLDLMIEVRRPSDVPVIVARLNELGFPTALLVEKSA